MIARAVELVRGFLRSNAAIYLGGSVLSRIGSIILIPLYTRRLTPEDYGEYAIAVSFLTVLPHCLSLGLTAGLIRVFFAEKDPVLARARVGSVARGMFAIVIATGLALALLTLLFVKAPLVGVRPRLFPLLVAAAAGNAMAMVPEVYLRAAQRPKHTVALQLTSFLSSASLALVFVIVLGRGVVGLVEAAACSSALMAIIAIVFVRLSLGRATRIVAETWDGLRVSLPLVPNVIAHWAQLTMDRWILTAYGASASLGTYYLAVQILSPITMVLAAWNDAQSARQGELYRAEGAAASYAQLGKTYRSYLAVALVPALGLVAGSPLLPLIIGPKFLGAIAIMPVLGAALVADAFYYPSANYLFFVGRTRLIPVATVVTTVLSTSMSILLLPRYGLPGLVACRFFGAALRAAAMTTAAWIAKPVAPSAPAQ